MPLCETTEYYFPGETQDNCTKCPEGATCNGGPVHALVVGQGWWRNATDRPDLIIQCPRWLGQSPCEGGDKCRDGHTGVLCAVCENGKGGTACHDCTVVGPALIVTGLGALYAGAFLFLVSRAFLQDSSAQRLLVCRLQRRGGGGGGHAVVQ